MRQCGCYTRQMSRVLLVLTLALTLVAPAAAQTTAWQIDPNHTAAQFSVRHMGISTVRGAFTKVSGIVTYDPANPGNTVIDVTIDAASIDTRVERRDNDLRSPRFFDTAKFPTLTFKSRRAEPNRSGKLKVIGDLTIHGVTKEVVLDVDAPSGPVKDPRGNWHMGTSAAAEINRQDFGVSADKGTVGDDIPIIIDVELIQPAAPAR